MKKAALSILFIIGVVGLSYFQNRPGPAANADDFVGQTGPEFYVADWISEKPNLRGKFLLIDFWATWCGPCIRAIPHLNELHASFGNQLNIVGVSNESRQKVESMRSPTMDYYSAIDTTGRMANFFKIRSIPHVVLMDPQGVVLYKGHPAYLTRSKIEAFLSAN